MKRTWRYGLLAAAGAFVMGAQSLTALASTAPGLGTASGYAILAGTPDITNTGSSVISGSVGVSPAAAVSGFPPGTIVNGTTQAGTAAAGTAKNDLTAAYGEAASSPCTADETGRNLGGQVLTPGTYCQTTAPALTGTLTLSGNGVFIFQTGSTLITAPNASVVLTNGAQPCNVFWQVSSSATLDTGTTFVGTIMALADVHLNNGASIAGRALARNGTVTLINNVITAPTTCSAVTVAGPAPSPGVTPAPGVTPTPGLRLKPPGTGGASSQDGGVPGMLGLMIVVVGSGSVVGIGRSRSARRRTSGD